ncbi:MAG: hypothetical protein KA140_00440 [Caldisericia bacterium]|nr:hypothetical protein [Caldisericia bacterium]
MKNLIAILTSLILLPFFSCINQVTAKTEPGYLIISATSSSSIDNLIQYRKSQGFNVIVKNTKDFSNSDGKVTATSIMEFLKENVKINDIRYLLIVGYDYEIPMVICHPEGNLPSLDMLVATPTDYPYCCPNSPWDKDGDGKLGEWPDDGICAFEPEIAVGRIPFSEPKKVSNACTSIIEFDSLSDWQKSKLLFAGAMLGYKGEVWEGKLLERTDGGYYCDKVWEDNFAGNSFSRFRMYEKEGFLPSPFACEEPLNGSNLIDKISDRYGLVLWTGHGNSESVVRTVWSNSGNKSAPGKGETAQPKLVTADIVQTKTVKWGIVVAASCSTADPSNTTNLGASFISSGASGYIGSSRVSWSPSYWRGPQDGGMDTILHLFCKYISKPGMTQGMALAKAKEEFGRLYFYGDKEDPEGAAQMNLYNYNLYGDPAVTLRSNEVFPNIIVDEPSIRSHPSSQAEWSGLLSGNIDESFKIQVVPSQKDMAWAIPVMVLGENKWNISVTIPAEIESGRRTWLIRITQGKNFSTIPIVLNIGDLSEIDMAKNTTPGLIGKKMPFSITLPNTKNVKLYEFIIKYDPYDVELSSIDHLKKPSSKFEIIDNYFGMAYIRGEGTFADDLVKVNFKASKTFTGKPIAVSSIRLITDKSTNLVAYPYTIEIRRDSRDDWRLMADFNDTGTVDDADMAIAIQHIFSPANPYRKVFDLKNDGKLNVLDLLEIKARFTHVQ